MTAALLLSHLSHVYSHCPCFYLFSSILLLRVAAISALTSSFPVLIEAALSSFWPLSFSFLTLSLTGCPIVRTGSAAIYPTASSHPPCRIHYKCQSSLFFSAEARMSYCSWLGSFGRGTSLLRCRFL
ncbi:uncharacterized protein EV420DRAFT_1513631, partial [Desarmillaria tabescens]